MHQSFDGAHPETPHGSALRFYSQMAKPGVWMCVGVQGGSFDREQWYYGGDGVWFHLGTPIGVWKDAVVMSCTIAGHILVIPDDFLVNTLPLCFQLQRSMLSSWLPSLWERVAV